MRYFFWLFLSCGLSAGEEIRFQHYTIDQGLSQSTVFAALQDKRGFLWFGTQDGLNRFDGYSFTHYRFDPQDDNSLSDNYIWCLDEDRYGKIWVGTNGGGLNRFDPESGRAIRFRHRQDREGSLASNLVYRVLNDRQERLWVGTSGAGLDLRGKGGRGFRHFRNNPQQPHSLPSDFIWSILQDSQDRIWVGTSAGLALLADDYGSFEVFQNIQEHPNSPGKNTVFAIYEQPDSKGEVLMVGTADGLFRFDERMGVFQKMPTPSDHPRSGWIRDLKGDGNGGLWVGSLGGLWHRDANGTTQGPYLHQPDNPHSPGNNSVYCLMVDRSNSLWMGTAGAGVDMYNQATQKFRHIRKQRNNPHSLASNLVLAIGEDARGRLLVGSWQGGLDRFDNHEVTHFRAGDGPGDLSSDRVRSLFLDSGGTVWLGADDGVIHRLTEDDRFIRFPTKGVSANSQGTNLIYAFEEDSAGRLWVATGSGGLMRLDPSGEFQRFTRRPGDPMSISHNGIYCIYRGDDDVLWLGTIGGGLNRFNPNSGKATRFSHDPTDPQSLASQRVRVITTAPDGTFWIGTDNGLNSFDGKNRFTRFTTADGLPNNIIYGIMVDDKGLLWISTNKGLSRYNPETGLFRNYGPQDGLQSNEFNTGAYYRGKDSTFYFGGVRGLNAFKPQQVIDDSRPPPVVFTAFHIFETSVEERYRRAPFALRELELDHHDNYFTVEFAALNFINPEHNRYAYKLEGLDQAWIYSGHRRFAGYTNLDPGVYTLRVKGANHDGYWNERGESLAITIRPPFWQAWWFKLLLVVTPLFIGLLIHRIRLQHMAEAKRELEILVAERTEELARKQDELLATNAKLSQTVNLLQHEVEKGRVAAQDLRSARDEAERGNRSKSDFLAIMSHEIRTPMNGVIGMTDLLVGTDLNGEQRELVNTIKLSGNTLLALVSDILDFSKIEAGKITLEKRPFSPRACVEHVVELLSSSASEQGLILTTNIEVTLPSLILGDETRLKQVLFNLVGNAVKFTAKGAVIVRVSSSHQAQPGEHVTLHFSVTDTGTGIPHEKLEELFQPFTQLDSSTTRLHGGTGLGLAICRRLVELMGGGISAESKPGQGSTFSFHIPVEIAHASVQKDPDHQPNTRLDPGLNILLAEDNALNRKVALRLLARLGYQADTAEDGLQVLARMKEKQYDLIFMDIQMPHMDGLTATREIRRTFKSDHQPRIVAMTANVLAGDRERCLEAGMDDYLSKPIMLAPLEAMLHKLFDSVGQD